MKIRKFSELREAAKDKAAKAQTTTKDKESDLFGTSRIKGEQDFRDAHGMDVQIKSNKLKDNDHFSPNMKPATHRADGEKQPVRQGNSSQPGPTKLFQVKEEEQINEDPSDGGGSDIRHHYNPKGEKPKLGKSGIHVLETGKGKYKVLQAPSSNRLNYGKSVKRGSEITNAHLSDHYEYGRGVVHVHTHNPKEHMMSHSDARKHFGEEIEQIEMNEDVFSSLKALASSNKSGNLKFKNGETGLVNSQSAGKIVDAYNKLSPENAKQMKVKMNSDVVGFMKVLHFVDKSAKAV